MDFQALRKEYENEGIDELEMPRCPIECLRQWLELATEKCPGKWFETNAISLATSDTTGDVTIRTVLLKGITDQGIQFFTNYDSEKGRQLAENPRAAVVVHWPYLGRQIRIRGDVTKTSEAVSEEYFYSRPRGAQLGAYVSRQSQRIESRHELDAAAEFLDARYEGEPVPMPANWGGYLLTAQKFEFWQGRLNRLHDRIVYQKNESGWERFRLAP